MKPIPERGRARTLLILLSFAAAALAADIASAYVPSTRTILNRLARGSGKGLYQIEQEVQFRTDAEPIVLRERWVVGNGDSMFLSVSGAKGSTEGWKLEVGYKDGRRFFVDDSGAAKSGPQSPEFIEPYLHFRSGKSVLEALIRQRVLPPNLASMQKRVKSNNGVSHQHETFVRLARSGGAVTYAFGTPAPVNAAKPPPGFWVDQDAFQFRKLRFPSAAEVEADKHFFAAGGLRVPRDRTVSWDNNTASIRIISVKSASSGQQTQKLLSGAGAINASGKTGGKPSAPKLPESQQVREFYQRFR